MAPKKPTTKLALRGDTTSTERARAHLERLGEAKGKRVLVDLDAPGREALETLVDAGYGTTQRDVVIKALVSAAEGLKKKD